MKTKIYFSKLKEDAIIPSKRDEDAGFDIYSSFEEKDIRIDPNEIVLISTGIACAFDSNYVLIVKERSSTGAKGMAVRMGVIDSGYRGEIKIAINNTGNAPIIISKDTECNGNNIIFHSYLKAIAQAILVPIPSVETIEITYEELLKKESLRGQDFLGASGK